MTHEIQKRKSSEESREYSLNPDIVDHAETVPDSGVSEDGSQISDDVPTEVFTVSVSDEIRRFQKEINTVAVEKFKFCNWKRERTKNADEISKKSSKMPFDNKESKEHEDGELKKNISQRNFASHCAVVGISEDKPHSLIEKQRNCAANCGSERSRQIQPSSHMPPSYLPNGEATEDLVAVDYNEEPADEEDDEIPELPSVKWLTNKFRTLEVDKQYSALKNAR